MKIINKKNLKIKLLMSESLVAYDYAINFMEERANYIVQGKNEAIWFLSTLRLHNREIICI